MPASSAPRPPLLSAASCWTAPCAQSLDVGLVGKGARLRHDGVLQLRPVWEEL